MRFTITAAVLLVGLYGITPALADNCDKDAAKAMKCGTKSDKCDAKKCCTTSDKGDAKKCCAASEKGQTTKVVAYEDKEGHDIPKDQCASQCANKVAKGTPLMCFVVGDKQTNCPGEAEELAGGDASKIKYAVGEKKYDNEADAKKAYGEALDGYLKEITQVQYVIGKDVTCCAVTAGSMAKKQNAPIRYRVAMVDFEDKSEAEKAAKLATEASEKVHMTCLVDGKKYQCDKQAEAACKASGKKAKFVIGDVTTDCDVTAKILVLRSKIDAAAEAVAKIHG